MIKFRIRCLIYMKICLSVHPYSPADGSYCVRVPVMCLKCVWYRFGGQFSTLYATEPANHFDTMWLACCTFYQLMTGENWDGVMSKAINAKGISYISYG